MRRFRATAEAKLVFVREYGDQSTTIRHFINMGLERLVDQGRVIDSPMIQARSADAKNEEGGGQT